MLKYPLKIFLRRMHACLKKSYLWRSVSILCLTLNMCTKLQNDPSVSGFCELLLDIGNGKVHLYEDTLPENFCNMVATKDELIKNIFPDLRT